MVHQPWLTTGWLGARGAACIAVRESSPSSVLGFMRLRFHASARSGRRARDMNPSGLRLPAPPFGRGLAGPGQHRPKFFDAVKRLAVAGAGNLDNTDQVRTIAVGAGFSRLRFASINTYNVAVFDIHCSFCLLPRSTLPAGTQSACTRVSLPEFVCRTGLRIGYYGAFLVKIGRAHV